jgi:hypothetical protein
MLHNFPELTNQPLDLTGSVEATTAGREDMHAMSVAQRVGDVYNPSRKYFVFVVAPRGGARYPPRVPPGLHRKRNASLSEDAKRVLSEARARRKTKSVKGLSGDPQVVIYEE